MLLSLLKRNHRRLFNILRVTKFKEYCWRGSWKHHVVLVTQARRFTSFDDYHHRIQLYPRDQDQHLIRIYNSKSLEDVLNVYNSISARELAPRHSAQVLSTLWDIYKSTHPLNNVFSGLPSRSYKYGWEFIDHLKVHPNFFDIVSHVADNCEVLDDESLACSMYSLLRFQYRLRDDPCQRIIEELCRRKSTLGLYALSRLLGSLKREDGLYSYIVMCWFLPRLSDLIDNINGDSELYQASSSLLSASKLISNSVYHSYFQNLNRLLEAPPEGGFQPETLCKIFVLLTQTNVSSVAARGTSDDGVPERIYKLDLEFNCCRQLLPVLNDVSTGDLLMIGYHIHAGRYLRPESFIEAYRQRMFQFKIVPSIPPCLACLIPARSYEERRNLSRYLMFYVNGDSASFEANRVFLYRLLGKCWIDYDLADKFWSKQYELLLASESDIEKHWTDEAESSADKRDFWNLDLTFRLCTQYPGLLTRKHVLDVVTNYLTFRRSHGTMYRHQDLEGLLNKIVGQFLTEDESELSVLLTEDYAKCIAFRASREPKLVIPKPEFVRNFSTLDIRAISNGSDLVPPNTWRYSHLDKALWRQKETLLTETVERHDLWKIVTMCSTPKRDSISHTLGSVLNRMAFEGGLKDPKCIRDILRLVAVSKFGGLEIFSQIGKIIEEYQKEMPPIVATQFLTSTLACGTALDVGVKACADIIERRKTAMTTFEIINSALALCFHGQLRDSLIHYIFDGAFLKKASTEMTRNRLSATGYDARIPLMELNRAICIDLPSANVPWFHQTFCEERVLEWERRTDLFFKEVDTVLEKLVGVGFYSRLTYSPYFYRIDFLIHLDGNGVPVNANSPSVSTDQDLHKVAIVLAAYSNLTANTRQLTGKIMMKKRHLEIMGYNVVFVHIYEWQRISMNDVESKFAYLRERLPACLNASELLIK